MSDIMRLSGINSGYDTESMIEAMMSSYQTKIDNQQRKLTKLSWQQEAFRDVTKKLTDFKNKYFDLLKRDTYLMSPNTFSKFKSSVSTKAAGETAKGLSVSTTSSSLEGSYKVKVDQLATASKLEGATMKPESFQLDLDKAAGSAYTTSTDENGAVTRNYKMELDIQVGSVSKTVAFEVNVAEVDGEIDMDAFKANAVDALNESLAESFGYTGRTENATGAVDADGKEYFLQAELNADGGLEFVVGGNAAVTVTEKTGNFGLTEAAKSVTISTQSAVTGKNTVAVEIDGKVKNVSFEGVSDTYYDSKDKEGNKAILEEYNSLKLAAYRKSGGTATGAELEKALEKFSYSSTQAAKDKNAAALTTALNDAFKDEGVKFTVDGSTVTAKSGSTSKEFTMTAIEGGTLGLAKGTSSNKYSAKTTLEDMGIESNTDNGGYSFTINGKAITLEKGATVNSLISAVNKSGAGVTMNYSALTNSFELTSNNMGSGESIDIEDNDITKALGLVSDGTSEVTFTRGQNAIFEINGETVYHNANSYTVDGTTFTADENIEIGDIYTVGISKSYDDVKQTIKDFVKDYNQLVDDIYGHIGTSPKRDSKDNTYEPLTDAEKEEMSEDEIKDWEEIAKKGVIYNDSTVSTIMSKLRSVLYNSVTLDDGSKFGLYSIGIKTSNDYKDHGKLEIDEDAFDAAFEKNPEAITKLFTDGDNGIMKQVNTVLDNAVRTTTTNKGSLIQKAGLESGATATDNHIYRQMKQITDRIATLQDRYDAKEEYWWGVFTNLESMMADFNEQSAYISSYMVQQ